MGPDAEDGMTASTVTIDGFVYGFDAYGMVVSCEKEPEPKPAVPPECWRTQTEWDAEAAHRATLLACRGQ